jgi:hypothetical protein
MLIIKDGLRIDQQLTQDNTSIILSNGTIMDTHTNLGSSVIDCKIPKIFNATSYIYYNVTARIFEVSTTEYPLDTIDILHPTLCPIVRVTIGAMNIVSFSYYNFALLDFSTPEQKNLTLANTTGVVHETSTVHGAFINTLNTILGIVCINVQDKGSIDLSCLLSFSGTEIELPSSDLDGDIATVSYLIQRNL